MDILKAEIARKRKLLEEKNIFDNNKKYFKRGQLLAKEQEEYLKKYGPHNTESEKNEEAAGKPGTANKAETSESEQTESAALPRAEVIKRLRERGHPILLFAENELQAFRRLRRIEIQEPEANRVNIYLTISPPVEKGLAAGKPGSLALKYGTIDKNIESSTTNHTNTLSDNGSRLSVQEKPLTQVTPRKVKTRKLNQKQRKRAQALRAADTGIAIQPIVGSGKASGANQLPNPESKPVKNNRPDKKTRIRLAKKRIKLLQNNSTCDDISSTDKTELQIKNITFKNILDKDFPSTQNETASVTNSLPKSGPKPSNCFKADGTEIDTTISTLKTSVLNNDTEPSGANQYSKKKGDSTSLHSNLLCDASELLPIKSSHRKLKREVVITTLNTRILNQDEADRVLLLIQKRIIDEATLTAPKGTGPEFYGKPIFTGCSLRLFCADQKTESWLMDVIRRQVQVTTTGERLVAKTMTLAKLSKRVVCGILIPDPLNIWDNPNTILATLTYQNPWAQCDTWILRSSDKQKVGWFLRVLILKSTIPTVLEYRRRLTCGVGSVYLKFQGPGGKFYELPSGQQMEAGSSRHHTETIEEPQNELIKTEYPLF